MNKANTNISAFCFTFSSKICYVKCDESTNYSWTKMIFSRDPFLHLEKNIVWNKNQWHSSVAKFQLFRFDAMWNSMNVNKYSWWSDHRDMLMKYGKCCTFVEICGLYAKHLMIFRTITHRSVQCASKLWVYVYMKSARRERERRIRNWDYWFSMLKPLYYFTLFHVERLLLNRYVDWVVYIATAFD